MLSISRMFKPLQSTHCPYYVCLFQNVQMLFISMPSCVIKLSSHKSSVNVLITIIYFYSTSTLLYREMERYILLFPVLSTLQVFSMIAPDNLASKLKHTYLAQEIP